MKNSIITAFTALTLVFSTYLYAAEDHEHTHKHEKIESHEQHHAKDDHAQHDGHVDNENTSKTDRDKGHRHSDHTGGNASKKPEGDK